MATVLQTVNNQLEYVVSGVRPIETYFVDDSYTDGVKAFRFSAIKGDGTVGGRGEISLQYADATAGIPAQGFFFDTSTKDRYGRGDDITPETNLFPKGERQNKGMGLPKKGQMIVNDDDSFKSIEYFRAVNEVLLKDNASITVVTGTSDTTINVPSDLTGDLKVGDYIKIEDATNSEELQVKAIDATTITTNTAITNDYDGGTGVVTLTALTMLQRPVYLIEGDQASTTLPVQTLVPTTSGNLKQIVGYIDSKATYRIDLSIDPWGTTIA